MDRRTAGIIATLASTLFCACPGLFLLLTGGLVGVGLGSYNLDIPGMGGSGNIPPRYGIILLCPALLMLLVPLVVGFFTLRTRPGQGG